MNKVYSIDSSEETLAVVGGPDSQSKSKVFLYDMKKHEAMEAILSQVSDVIDNPQM